MMTNKKSDLLQLVNNIFDLSAKAFDMLLSFNLITALLYEVDSEYFKNID